MSKTTPPPVAEAIKKLESADQAVVQTYIENLEAEIKQLKGDDKTTPQDQSQSQPCDNQDDVKAKAVVDNEKPTKEEATAEAAVEEKEEEEAYPPMYQSGDDMDQAGTYKMEASDLKSAGNYAAAMDKYTLAIQAASPSALLLANRADALLRLGRSGAAVRDCSCALEKNPDSAKALRIRGRAYKELGEYEKSRKDLSSSQGIDYDDDAAEDLKFVTEKVKGIDKEKVQKKLEEEKKLKKRAEEIRKAQEEARREAEEEERKDAEEEAEMGDIPPMGGMPGGMGDMPGGMGGMPGGMGGMPGGMGGMPGGAGGPGGMGGMGGFMSALLSDPELAAGMQNPKVMAAFSGLMAGPGGAAGLMSNPAKMQELMGDPEVGPFIQKLMKKLGPMMGGAMPGAPGGMGGAGEDDDLPDLDDVPNL